MWSLEVSRPSSQDMTMLNRSFAAVIWAAWNRTNPVFPLRRRRRSGKTCSIKVFPASLHCQVCAVWRGVEKQSHFQHTNFIQLSTVTQAENSPPRIKRVCFKKWGGSIRRQVTQLKRCRHVRQELRGINLDVNFALERRKFSKRSHGVGGRSVGKVLIFSSFWYF